MTEGNVFSGGGFSSGLSPEGQSFIDFSSESQMMSIPPELAEKQERERAAIEKGTMEREIALSGDVCRPLVRGEILTSQDSSRVVFGGAQEDFSESPEMKWEHLYEEYVSNVIADTLHQNKDFPNHLMTIAASELPGHPQLREMYKKGFELRDKKDQKSKEELDLVVGEIEAILKWYSLEFREDTLNKSLGLQAIVPLAIIAREAVMRKGHKALKKYDEAVASANTTEEKFGVVTEVLVREDIAQQDPEAVVQLDEEIKETTSPDERKMVLMRAAIRAELVKKSPEALAQFDKKLEEALTPEDKEIVLMAAIEELNNPQLKSLFDEWKLLGIAAKQKVVEEARLKAEEEAKKKAEEEAKKKAQEKKPKGETVTGVSSVTTDSNYNSYAYDQARGAMFSSGASYELSADGTLSLGRDISVQVEVDKAGRYYLVDEKYADGGKVGPFGVEDFAIKAYERFIDGYISRDIRGRLKNPDEISGISDNQLVTVGKALLGRGDQNGYKVKGDDLKVLDGLVESLLVEDEKYPTLNKKMFALYKKVYKSMDSKTLAISGEAAAIRKKLLGGETKSGGGKQSVSELLGEDKLES